MARKERYPPEPETKRDHKRPASTARQSGAAPKSDRERAEAPTEPPPAGHNLQRSPLVPRSPPVPRRSSEVRPAEATTRRGSRRPSAAATVDEVVADMSKDPRRERDGDE